MVILGYDNMCADGLNMLTDMNSIGKISHVLYQSMKGFFLYVYEIDGVLSVDVDPLWANGLKTIQPVAALFEVKK